RIVQGDLALALRDSDRALEIAREVQDPQQLHPALLSRARALFNDGRRDESNTLLDELLAARPALNEYWFRELAWVLLEHGREAEYLEAAEGEAITPWLEAGLAVARHDFPAAAAHYERIGAKGTEAVARLHVAELLIGQGDRGAADAELRQARAFFLSEEADPYLRRCEALLAAAS